eukprot:SAG11_NODE_54_length_19571_cov_29.437786_27_plen_79_part_00
MCCRHAADADATMAVAEALAATEAQEELGRGGGASWRRFSRERLALDVPRVGLLEESSHAATTQLRLELVCLPGGSSS